MRESAFIHALRALPLHSGARGLMDDAAVLGDLVLTHDMLAEGVHYLASDPPQDVAWKLLAVNLSDLAAKGARPRGVLLGYPLAGDSAWDAAFLDGLGAALATFECPLLGGDTIALAPGAPRILSLTALGASGSAPARSGAKTGDALWVTGTIGDAGAGLKIAQGAEGPPKLLARYRRPRPRLAEGQALGPVVHAMMDVSDGLLIDADRMAKASGLAVSIDLGAVPLSAAYAEFAGTDRPARLAAVTAGDDYELLFAAAPGMVPPVPAARIGAFATGAGITLTHAGEALPLPARLGFEHG
ncbi:thiamine-phosphate kinase [Sphingomonas sp. dw_22]|uniref:thiamine-phosphate kinase n=1 Tax=Sphingomonas sp. dw_22 TaxID=2721175 RepID=UPI001BD3FA4C|nr:thiamine-phosphate kinase [Sphingomonas sp. dw_22]